MKYTFIELVEELFTLLESARFSGALLKEEENLLHELETEWYSYHFPNMKEED